MPWKGYMKVRLWLEGAVHSTMWISQDTALVTWLNAGLWEMEILSVRN